MLDLSLACFLCGAVFKYFLLGSLVDVFEAVLLCINACTCIGNLQRTTEKPAVLSTTGTYHAHKIEALNKTASHFSKASLSTEKGKTTPFRDAIEGKVEFPHMAKFEVNITCPELPRVRSYPGYLIVLGIVLGDSTGGEFWGIVLGDSTGG